MPARLQGHAASDNWFVAVEGDDIYPDLAIGRFPVVEPEEVAAIVAKTIRYGDQAGDEPWRSRALFITDENQAYQEQSDDLIDELSSWGLDSSRVYARLDDSLNDQHRATLGSEIGSGQLLVHFWGHGGRCIWRTGKPDLNNQSDLFNLEDLDNLPEGYKLVAVEPAQVQVSFLGRRRDRELHR